jgi:hypothetical protein
MFLNSLGVRRTGFSTNSSYPCWDSQLSIFVNVSYDCTSDSTFSDVGSNEFAMYVAVNICLSFIIGGYVSSHCIDAYWLFLRHDGSLNSISSGIGSGGIGVASIVDPNVEYDISSGEWLGGTSVSFLISSYSSSFVEDSSSRDNNIGIGSYEIGVLVFLCSVSALGQQVSVCITGPCKNPNHF